MTPEEFYLEHYDESDGFGNPRPNGTRHRGIDVNGLPHGEPVPSWLDGVVVGAYRNSVLGNLVVVKRADSLFAGFCHLDGFGVSVGDVVKYGQNIGPLGETGSAAAGPHLHATASWVGDDPGSSPVVDPWPLIQQSIAAHAPKPKEQQDMTDLIYYAAAEGKPASVAIPSGPNKGLSVAVGSMWYQEAPGAPLFALTQNADYAKGAWKQEYQAFLGARGGYPDGGRSVVSPQEVADLISLRGTTTKPIGNFGGTVTATADPALLAAVKELGTAIVALPAEIDRYADGRKQAS